MIKMQELTEREFYALAILNYCDVGGYIVAQLGKNIRSKERKTEKLN